MSTQVKMFQGDALTTLKKLPDDFVQCCVTSPPYFNLRDYGVEGQIGREQTPEEFIDKLVEVFNEVKRVLKPDGTCWINIGDTWAANRTYQVPSTKGGKKHSESQANGGSGSKVPPGYKSKDLIGVPWMLAFALRKAGWYLRQDIIWHKPNAMPESVKDRCGKSHEYVFLLSKSEKYYFDYQAIQEDSLNAGQTVKLGEKSFSKGQAKGANVAESGSALSDTYTVKDKKNKRSVWSITTKPLKEAHFAPFPKDLVEPCILAGTKEGDIVLDPFGGSGTTGLVAQELGRKCILIELNPEYVEIANRRVNDNQ